MNIRFKRGLSPVVATVLLISLALILALIVFIWAKTFIGEKIEKAGRAIEFTCDEVEFEADAYLIEGSTLVVDIQNDGTVPLYGLEIKKKERGTIKNIVSKVFDRTLGGGRTANMTILSTDVNEAEWLNPGDTIVIAPTLLGKQGDVRKAYTCEKNAQEVSVR